MDLKVFSFHVMSVYFIWMYQEQLVYNLEERTTMKQTTMGSPGESTFSYDSAFNDSVGKSWETEIISYTDWYLEKLAGWKIDVKKLMTAYSTVCPIQQSCDMYFEEKYLFADDTYGIPAFSECESCECSRSCIDDGNCCPGTHFGYIDHQCVNTVLYPKTKSVAYYMVGICLDRYIENNTVKELCDSKVHPCTSLHSGLIYKNRYCAQCSSENGCIEWTPEVECTGDELFQESFDTFSDMKVALNQSDCVIEFKYHTVADVGFSCYMNDYLKETRINKCNVTGLWRHFDADIDWACKNFIVPYKVFKNIYCYICNPSYGNALAVSLIDSCKTYENSSSFLNLSNACTLFPASDRLKPFKNIYCYACNHGQTLIMSSETDVSHLRDISEANDHENLSTQINISLIFPHENNVKDVEEFVHGEMQYAFKVDEFSSKPNGHTKTNYNATSIDRIINHYITVCGKETLCMYNGRTDNIYGNPVCGHCSCENDCAENEICCLDTLLSTQPYTCLKPAVFPVHKKNYAEKLQNQYEWKPGIKIIDKCLNKTHILAYKCSSNQDASDLFTGIPISTYGDIAYRNIYCYACNNIYKKDIILDILAYCRTYIEYDLFTNLSELLHAVLQYCHTLKFVPLRSKACVEEYDAMQASFVGGKKYERKEVHPSELYHVAIQNIEVPVWNMTNQIHDVYSSCNITGYSKDVDVLVNGVCENNSVNLLSLPEYRVENRVYKNFACFLCNPNFQPLDLDSDELISECRINNSVEWYERNEILEDLCTSTQTNDIWFPYKNMYCAECNLPPWQLIIVDVAYYDVKSPPFYKYLFSISPEDFAQVDSASTEDDQPQCTDGTYDYILNQCRSLYCNRGYQLNNSTCKATFESASNHLYEASLKVHIRAVNGLTENSNNSLDIDFDYLCSSIIDTMTIPFEETTDFYLREARCQASSLCKTFQNTTVADGHIVDIVHTEFINLYFVVAMQYTYTITAVRTTLVNTLNQTYVINDILDNGDTSHSIVLDTVETKEPEWLNLSTSCLFVNPTLGRHDGFSYYIVDRFLLCAFVKLNFSEVNFHQDTLVVSITDRNVTFSETEYKVIGNDTIICIDDFNRKTKQIPDENLMMLSSNLTYYLNMFTFVCTVISLTCLFLTFIIYCLFSTLRTVPGKSIMLLCFSLFCSQTFLQFGIDGTSMSGMTVCIFTGVCIHYFWIAFFCAMNICSFHMFKVFYFYDLANQLPRNENIMFIKYLLYFILVPLALVLVTILISVLNSDASGIGYGAIYCFISDFYIFVGTFLTPACLIFLSNFIFFSLAFHKIRTSPNVRSTQDKNTFFIFLKLCTIVGVTWPLLIVDNMLDVSWFSFVVSGINSLQGVFIFVSFILNRRVIHLCKSSFKKTSDKKSVSRTTSRTSYSVINRNPLSTNKY